VDETRSLIAAGLTALTRQATTPPAPYGYGRDLKCVTDLTTSLEDTNPKSVESLAQDLFHRVTTERGTIVDDPDFGDDVRDALSGGLTPAALAAIGGRVELECLKDDRVSDVDASADLTAPGELTITIAVTPKDPALQPFEMVLAVTNATALLLEIR
jgi:hypothetical protein